MNIKIQKKFVLGGVDKPPVSQKEQQQQVLTHYRFCSSQMVSTFLDESGIEIQARDGPGAPVTVSVREQITQFEDTLNQMLVDLENSKNDMAEIKQKMSLIPANLDQELEQFSQECGEHIQQLQVELLDEIASYQTTQIANTENTVQLRVDFEDLFKVARETSLQSNFIVNEVGFRQVYKF